MRPLRALAIYLAVVFLGGALLAPWLHQLALWGAGHVGWLEDLARSPFHRFVNRSLLLLAVVGLWPLMRGLGVKGWRDVGLGPPAGQWRNAGKGFTLGFVSLAGVAFVAFVAGARSFQTNHTLVQISAHLTNAGLAAVVVSVIEELLFRGAIFGGLRRAYRWPTALLVSSAVYALVHFFDRPGSPQAVVWWSGFATLAIMLQGFIELERLVPGFFNLTLAGVLLGLAYQRTGTLYFSIGLHAGWIFWLKSYGFLTGEIAGANTWLWGTGRLIDGWLALFVLAGALVFANHWLLPTPRGQTPADSRSP
ncbi:MAG: CPBP family intramembrane metalloprotease [Pedosphaera parvula]|nr:CPBP family intramembrane metalloprotease [Pedosphaera parvula]